MNDDAESPQEDRKVLSERPGRDIFEIRFQSTREIRSRLGASAIAFDLCQAGNAGLERVAVPISRVDLPEEIIAHG